MGAVGEESFALESGMTESPDFAGVFNYEQRDSLIALFLSKIWDYFINTFEIESFEILSFLSQKRSIFLRTIFFRPEI